MLMKGDGVVDTITRSCYLNKFSSYRHSKCKIRYDSYNEIIPFSLLC